MAVSLGAQGELLAQAEYRKRGYEIVGANFFNRRGKQAGEIDFVALAQDHIAFVEVKTRRAYQDRFGGARYAVDAFKQRKLRKIVQLFLLKHPQFRNLRPQIDVCLIEGLSLDKGQVSVTIIPNTVMDDR